MREDLPLTVLVWVDDAYGLIEWNIDLEMGQHSNVGFANPDLVAYARSFGGDGYRVTAADELLPALRTALDSGGVSVIACPMDYRENLRLTERLARGFHGGSPSRACQSAGGCR